jgi:hypothetical protein
MKHFLDGNTDLLQFILFNYKLRYLQIKQSHKSLI